MSEAIVRPGDKLVIGINDILTQEQWDTIKEEAAKRLPGVEVVGIDSCSGLVVYRGE